MEEINYYELLKKHIDDFRNYFGEQSLLYMDICFRYWKDSLSFKALGQTYNYSESQVRRIVKNVENFLLDPYSHLNELNGTVEQLDKAIILPTNFFSKIEDLSAVSLRLLQICIYWYQHKGTNKIPISYLISMSQQCIRHDRRKKFLDELSTKSILLKDNAYSKIFEYINENDHFIRFKFTEECLDFISPSRYFFKCLSDKNITITFS